MQLRPNKTFPGYYKNIHNGKYQCSQLTKRTSIRKVTRNTDSDTPDDNSNGIQTELKHLNFIILKHLRGSARHSPLIRGKLDISDKFAAYLVQKYGIKTHRYTSAFQMLLDNHFFLIRFFNETDYCSIFANDFRLRIQKPKTLRFFPTNTLTEHTITYSNVLFFSFGVKNGVLA